MTIDGVGQAGTGENFEVFNPATGEIFAVAPEGNSQIADQAVAAAAGAFPAWSSREDRERAALLLECSRVLKGQTMKLAKLLTQEQGKPLRDSMNEIMGAAVAMRHAAEMDTPPAIENLADGIEILRRPRGVVAAITPWNFPVILAIWKIAPALRAGNTIVLKPSPFTPLTSLEIGRLFREILPPGVLNVISGKSDELGEALTKNPDVRMITLTGSVETGKAVARAAADDLKHVVLELGGNDAAIVLPDADPTKIAKDLFQGAFRNCGQLCLAIKRLYVHDSIFASVVDELKSIAESLVVGDGLERGIELGPLNNLPQLERVEFLVNDARENGARIVTGGSRRPGPGFFFEPTIVDEIQEGIALVDEEQFGPVLPVIRYDDVEDAVARANASSFGLGGSVWSSDPARAADVASKLDCGAIWVNGHGETDPGAPIGGKKLSGIGYANGQAGLGEFLELRTLYRGRSA